MLTQICRVTNLVVHRVGNPSRDEPLRLSDRASGEIEASVSALILDGYFKGIYSEKKKYQFCHAVHLSQNTVYRDSRAFFQGEISFLEVSQRLARHLYAHSQHPKIHAGDVLVVLFEGLGDGDSTQRALGVFKSEVQEELLTVIESGAVLDVAYTSGMNPHLIDKGALILESEPIAYAVDRFGQETKFWLEDFLQVIRVPDVNSSSQLLSRAVEHIAAEIHNPIEQARFQAQLLEACKQDGGLSSQQVRELAEPFVPDTQVHHAFDQASSAYGFALDERETLPARHLTKRLEKSLSRYAVGHGMSVLLPSNLSLNHVHVLDDGDGELTFTLKLSRLQD